MCVGERVWWCQWAWRERGKGDGDGSWYPPLFLISFQVCALSNSGHCRVLYTSPSFSSLSLLSWER